MKKFKPEFNPTISFGNLITLALLLVGFASAWVNIELRGKHNQVEVSEIRISNQEFQHKYDLKYQELEKRVDLLEIQIAVNNERYSYIVKSLDEIKTSLSE